MKTPVPASMTGAIESITCSHTITPEGVALYVEHGRIDGTHAHRSIYLNWDTRYYSDHHFGKVHYYNEVPDPDNIIWSECFSSVAFDPNWPMRDYIPVVCDVFFRRPDLNRLYVTAHLRINRVGVFNLPLTLVE
jgi:hypothetical protein